MVFSRFQVGIVLRVIIILGLSLLIAYSIFSKHWFFTPLVAGIALVTVIIELNRHLSFYHRSLNNFLVTIRQSGFSTTFPSKGKSSEELFQTFNEITQVFQNLALEKESHFQFLQTLTNSIEAGLISFYENGDIQWLNPEAKKFIGKPGVKSITDLKKYQPGLGKILEESSPDTTKKILKLEGLKRETEISVQIRTMRIGKELIKIVLLQNIHNEMEIKEVEAWQKLTRVMRHEIMNSMTPIVNLTEAVNKVLSEKSGMGLEDNYFEDIKESIETIENRSKGLVKFVNAYKDFSQTPEVNLSNFSPTRLLERVKSLVANSLEDNGIELKISIKPTDASIYADEELLEQVVINIVKNSIEAIQYSDNKNGSILISGRKEGHKFLIKIIDNGPGMRPAILDQIFVPFYTTKKEGSGIGLSLSRQLIQLQGGTIRAISKLGSGTTFIIEI